MDTGANGEPNWIVRPPSLPVSCILYVQYPLVHLGWACRHISLFACLCLHLLFLGTCWVLLSTYADSVPPPLGWAVTGREGWVGVVGDRCQIICWILPSLWFFLYNLQTRRYNHLSNVISVQNFRELAHTILNREGILQLLRNEWDGFF